MTWELLALITIVGYLMNQIGLFVEHINEKIT